MGRKKAAAPSATAGLEQALRDQEVLRANRELAAYFRGRRTEREARAALKIIKAFVRDRERQDPKSRSPLPGKAPAKAAAEHRPGPRKARRRRPPAAAAAPTGTAGAPLRAVSLDTLDPASE